ncbi:MAG: glycosyltransferase family 4 protein [Anaerolineae bacterium]|nr:glycosyltransferase family 4 protein [Anaerolineae bacterium]
MRILHVTHNYHPVVGGAELMMKHISEGLAKRGHQVMILTSNAPSAEAYVNSRIKTLPSGDEIINGVVVKRLPILQLPRPIQMLLGGIMVAFWRGNCPFNDLVRILWNGPRIRGLRRQIMKAEVDLVVAIPFPFLHIYRAFSAASKKGVPLVVIPCSHPLDAFSFENPRHYRLLQSCQAVIANTGYEKEYLISMGVPGEKIHVAGEGVNPEDFDGVAQGDFRCKYGIGDHEKVILFVGRKAGGKGLRALLTAMQSVWQSEPGAKLVIAGSSTEFFRSVIEPRIAQLPEELERNVISIDDFKEPDKASLYRDCDIFVLPSNVESFGIVFLEAWICGKPVIGCRTGPVASVISEGQDGLLVPYGDAEELAQAIMLLLADESLCRRLGHNGRQKVLRQYTWDRIVSKVESIYQTLVQEREVYGSTPG